MPQGDTSAAKGANASAPSRISASGWKEILLRVKTEISRDHISVVAAGVAFYALLSIFPAIAALISIAGLILDPAQIAAQLDTVMAMLPESAAGAGHDAWRRLPGFVRRHPGAPSERTGAGGFDPTRGCSAG